MGGLKSPREKEFHPAQFLDAPFLVAIIWYNQETKSRVVTDRGHSLAPSAAPAVDIALPSHDEQQQNKLHKQPSVCRFSFDSLFRQVSNISVFLAKKSDCPGTVSDASL